jgi:hypothetical protein
VQVFTKNNNQWRAKEITAEEAMRFADSLRELQIVRPLSHASYLINLASGSAELWERSVAGMVVELERASQLIYGQPLPKNRKTRRLLEFNHDNHTAMCSKCRTAASLEEMCPLAQDFVEQDQKGWR